MSTLTEGPILTSIADREYPVVPRNVNSTVSNSQGLFNVPSDDAEALATTSTTEDLVGTPRESQEPAADNQESEAALRVLTTEVSTEETGLPGEVGLATTTEAGLVVSATQKVEDVPTQVTEKPTHIGGEDKLKNGDIFETGSRVSLGETSGSKDDDRSSSKDDDRSSSKDDDRSSSKDDDRSSSKDADRSDNEDMVPTQTEESPGTLASVKLENEAMATVPSEPIPSDGGSGSPSGLASSNSAGLDDSRKVGVIAGTVVGAVSAVALIVFLLWFWRKRSQRHKYSIRTPVFDAPQSGKTEKTWEFDTASVGPTPRSARFAEAVKYKLNTTGNMLKPVSSAGWKRGAKMNGGDSKCMNSPPPAALVNGRAAIRSGTNAMSAKENVDFNGSRPVARGAGGRNSPDRRASDGSAHQFSGALGLMPNDARARGNNPFSDIHAVQQNLQPRANPFDDGDQAVAPLATTLPQATYDPRPVQRPRGSTTGSILRRYPSSSSRANARSDQFDLEIGPHPGTLVRPDSYTSRVSSVSDWAELGPGYRPAGPDRTEQIRPGGVGEAL
ncbi:hypothetical protein ACO1O0_007352 [Amphichorda felina]